MKTLLIIFMMLGHQFVSGQSNDAREKLGAITGSDQTSAQKLLLAIRNHSMDQVRTEMKGLVQNKKPHLVSLALTDPSDQVKAEAVKALASVKSRSIAMAILDASKMLNYEVLGGTEATNERKQTKLAFEQSLTSITGVVINKSWSQDEKIKEFRKAAEKLPE